MAERIAGPEIERLIQLLARLPGLGPRSARRAALHLIRKREELLGPLGEAMRVAKDKIVTCSVCGNIDTSDPCSICADRRRDPTTHSGGGDHRRPLGAGARQRHERPISCARRRPVAARRRRPRRSELAKLVGRVAEGGVKEVILAVNATVDGQTTAHYITEILAHLNVKCSRLAHGVPVGGELDYLDEGTLAAALRSRTDL